MQNVKIKKVNTVDVPVCPTPEWRDYILGEDNGDVSPPLEYTIEGIEMSSPVVGEGYRVLRTNRNGVKKLGLFSTSIVKKITSIENDTIIETTNSVYMIKYTK